MLKVLRLDTKRSNGDRLLLPHVVLIDIYGSNNLGYQCRAWIHECIGTGTVFEAYEHYNTNFTVLINKKMAQYTLLIYYFEHDSDAISFSITFSDHLYKKEK